MNTNFEKMSVKKPLDAQFHDTEGHAYISKARKEKRNKPQRGGGVKGLFRDPSKLNDIGDSYAIYG